MLVTEPGGESNFHFFAIKNAREIEEVDLDAELRRWLVQGRAMADIQDRAMSLAGDRGVGGVNSIRRQGETGGVEIGGGESEFASEFVACDNFCREGVRAAEHLARAIEVACAKDFADARAADDLAIERNGRDAMHGEVQFAAERSQKSNVAAAFVAEHKIRTDTDGLNGSQIAGELADEGFTGLLAERAIEAQQEQRVRPERLNRAELLRLRIDEWWHFFRRDNGAGVLIEGDDKGKATMLAGVGDGLPDDLLVTEMDAVEHADGEADFAIAVGEAGGAVANLHRLIG